MPVRGIVLRVIKTLLVLCGLICGCFYVAVAKISVEEVAKSLPRQVADFRLSGTVRTTVFHPTDDGKKVIAVPTEYEGFATVWADYVSSDSQRFRLRLDRFERDSDAYEQLTLVAHSMGPTDTGRNSSLTRDVGTASLVLPRRIAFFKGSAFVEISALEDSNPSSEKLFELATAFANQLGKGEGDIPILVKHLPQWETAQTHVVYLAGFRSLKALVPNQPILEAINSEGDADAVLAKYGTAQFLLVEFNTPQLAGDTDRAITAKLEELRQSGQPLPTSYRKVGNYSVFVFNATSEAEAKSLIDQVEYAQMVTWLGNNPYLLEQAQREYYETTAGVLVSVVLASGLSLLLCFGIGGAIGALVFRRRRAQQRAAEAYSDAGGMLRLNLDDITPPSDPAKLLGP